MVNNVEKAAAHYANIDAEWTDIRPEFALIHANLLLAQGQLEAAQSKANEIKQKLANQWTPAHQEIFDQIEESVANNTSN